MTRQHSSSFNALDLLNQAAALAQGGATEVRAPNKPPTKFENVVNSLNSFLTTATGTVITVDGIINGSKQKPTGFVPVTGQPNRQQPIPGQHATAIPKGQTSFTKLALWGGVAVGGSALAYTLLSAKKKSK